MNISVVIPAYNSESFLRDAVESALAQPQAEELMLVDDGSSDGTLDLCHALAAGNARIRVLRHADHANHGISASRNLGIRSARCDWVAFLDSDDCYLPGRFDEDGRVISRHPDADGVYDASIGVPFGEPMPAITPATRLMTLRGRPEPDKLFDWLLEHPGEFFHTSAILLRRGLIERLGFFNTRLRTHEDTALWYMAAAAGRLFPGKLDAPVSVARFRPDSITNSDSRKHREGRYAFTLSVLAWARRNHLSRERLDLIYRQHFANVLLRMNSHPSVLVEKAHMLGMLTRVVARDPRALGTPALRNFLRRHSGLGGAAGKEALPQ